MNPLIQLKAAILPLLITFTVACFAVSPMAYAGEQSRPTPPPSTQDVNVVNTPSVNVINTPTVQDRDNPARQPFQATASGNFVDGSCDVQITLATVPEGKTLVIQDVSFLGTTPQASGHSLVRFHIATTAGDPGVLVRQHFPLAFSQSDDCPVEHIDIAYNKSVNLYAKQGTDVVVGATRASPSGNDDTFEFAISGYLVDCLACPAGSPKYK
jgi:hypothetical protein